MTSNLDKIARTDHPVITLIAERYSPYAFEPRAVEHDKLLTCLEAARWAASSFNEQPWSFIVAPRDDQATFERALGCLVEANQQWAKYAGALMLTTVKRTFSRNDKPNRVAEHDLGLAMGNFTMQAQSLGLHVHQMAGIDIDKVRQTYSVPEGHDPMTAVAVGYAANPDQFDNADLADRDRGARKRKPLAEFVFGEAFGKASSLVE